MDIMPTPHGTPAVPRPRNDGAPAQQAPAGRIVRGTGCYFCPLCKAVRSNHLTEVFAHMRESHRIKVPPVFAGDAVEELHAKFSGFSVNPKTKEVLTTCYTIEMRQYERKERRRAWLQKMKRLLSKVKSRAHRVCTVKEAAGCNKGGSKLQALLHKMHRERGQ